MRHHPLGAHLAPVQRLRHLPQMRRLPPHHMSLQLHLVGIQPRRVPHPRHPVQPVAHRNDMQHLLVPAVQQLPHRPRSSAHQRPQMLLRNRQHPVAAAQHLPRVAPHQMVAVHHRIAVVHRIAPHIPQALPQRLPHRLPRGLGVLNHPVLHTLRRRLPRTHRTQLPLRPQPGHDGHHLAGADVHGGVNRFPYHNSSPFLMPKLPPVEEPLCGLFSDDDAGPPAQPAATRPRPGSVPPPAAARCDCAD